MGLTPPVGLVDPACRRPLPPPVIRASSIAFLPLLPVLVRPRPRGDAICRVLPLSQKSLPLLQNAPQNLT